MTIPRHGTFSYRLYKLFVLNPGIPVDTKPIQREVGQIRFFRRLYAARDRYGWDIQKVTPGSVDGLFVYRPDGDSPTKQIAKVQLPDPSQLTIRTADYWWEVAKEKLDREWDKMRTKHGDKLPVGSYCFLELRFPIPRPEEGGPAPLTPPPGDELPLDPSSDVVFSAD